MKNQFKNAVFIAVAMCLGVSISLPALAASKDTLVVTGLTDSNGFTPTLSGSPSQYFYATTIPAGTAVADIIPIQLDLFDTDGVSGETITVTFSAVGQIASSISFDTTSLPMTDPSSSLQHAYINTTALAPGDYHANIQIKGSPASGVTGTHDTLHLLVHVVGPGPQPPLCYITDSDGLLLNDCTGNPVITGGEFFIVTNQKKVTATNPGQFYFNFVWTNATGAPVTFTSLGLNGTNVVPHGTNSVHVLIYDSSSFVAHFDDVNNNGTPCGQTGAVCKSPITVPNGDTLWLTWHLEYSFLGKTPPAGLLPSSSCPASTLNGTISVSAELKNAAATVDLVCGGGAATANGYTLK